MSSESVQKTVLAELRGAGDPMAVSQLIEQIRKRHPEFKDVSDFDIRSAILGMLSVGVVELTTKSLVFARVAAGVPARG